MPTLPLHPSLPSASSATATSSPAFVETAEYSRFVEFSDACRQYRYIGLCFGPPGVGKSLSALRYSRSEMIVPLDRWSRSSGPEAHRHSPVHPGRSELSIGSGLGHPPRTRNAFQHRYPRRPHRSAIHTRSAQSAR